MNTQISAKDLRASLPELVKKLRFDEQFTVPYGSCPPFQIIPSEDTEVESGLCKRTL